MHTRCFVGEGAVNGSNLKPPGYAANDFSVNQTGINDLMVFEAPGEFNFKVG